MKPEQQTQCAILQWLDHFPEVRQMVVKIDNEGARKVIVRKGQTIPVGHILANKMGLHKGASDLFIAFPTPEFCGLWLEIKPDGWKKPRNAAEKLRVETQQEFLNKMKAKGYQGHFVIGVDQGIQAIKDYLRVA